MPIRSALTTFATALTIPVNIHVSSEEQVVAKADVIEIAEVRGLSQVFHAVSAQGSGRVAAADQTGRDIGVDLVDEALCKERCMYLAAALDEQAEHSASSELIEQWQQRDSTVGRGGQSYHLGRSHPA